MRALVTVQPSMESFLAAAYQALAGPSPQEAMQALLETTVETLCARSGITVHFAAPMIRKSR